MASPISPPAPHHTALPNPKKRPSLATPSVSSIKRPKLHPLRQTSFPADVHAATSSARSETGSLVSGSSRAHTSTEKRGRGRPRKNGPQSAVETATTPSRQDREDARTLVSATGGGAAQGSRSVVSGGEEDDEGETGGWAAAPENLDAADKARKEEDDREENRRLLRLMSTFTAEQEHRHRMYKRSFLNKATLKRIVNQTVSQSVTALPLIAIGAYSKYFVGEIVTRALDVQLEWAAAFDARVDAERSKKEVEKEAEKNGNGNGDTADIAMKDTEKDDFVPNPHKGGLLPDHLREALRRYKGDGEGGGVGFGSTSLGMMGSQGAGTLRVGNGVGARRLFR